LGNKREEKKLVRPQKGAIKQEFSCLVLKIREKKKTQKGGRERFRT